MKKNKNKKSNKPTSNWEVIEKIGDWEVEIINEEEMEK